METRTRLLPEFANVLCRLYTSPTERNSFQIGIKDGFLQLQNSMVNITWLKLCILPNEKQVSKWCCELTHHHPVYLKQIRFWYNSGWKCIKSLPRKAIPISLNIFSRVQYPLRTTDLSPNHITMSLSSPRLENYIAQIMNTFLPIWQLHFLRCNYGFAISNRWSFLWPMGLSC